MHLTPRTLLMALTACLIGGLVLGGVSSLASISMPSAPTPTTFPSPSGYSEADLGDAEITMPTTSPEASVSAAQVAPSPAVSQTVITPTDPIAAQPTSSRVAASPSASKDMRSTKKPASRPTADSTRASRAATNPSLGVPFDQQAGSARAARPRALDGWKPPVLHVGTNQVGSPRLSTGASVAITVMCSPSSACSLGGGTLEIGSNARAVTVTWSSVRSTRSAGWSASSRL